MKPNAQRIILTIREYENSIHMPVSERLTYLAADKSVHLKAGDTYAFRFKEYADKCFEYLRFGDDVDLATTGGFMRYESLRVCDTPVLFQKAGLGAKPMLYTQRHLTEAMRKKSPRNSHWHGIPITLMKQLPALLEQPAILCDSPSRKDTILAVLCAVDKDGLPLILAIQPNGKGFYGDREISTNMILSVYGKYDLGNYLSDKVPPEKVIYISKEKSQELERLARLQLPGNYSTLDFNTILHHPQCIVNGKNPGKSIPRSLTQRTNTAKELSSVVNAENPYPNLNKRREHER